MAVMRGAPFTALIGLALFFAANSASADTATSTVLANTTNATTNSVVAPSVSPSIPGSISSTTPLGIATSTAPSLGAVLNCASAYTADLYDTASGHAAPGANIIGTQSWVDCKDRQGNQYEFKLSPGEYGALGISGAQMPEEFADASAEVRQEAETPGAIINSSTTPPVNSAVASTEAAPVMATSTTDSGTSTPSTPDTAPTSTPPVVDLPSQTATTTSGRVRRK